MNERREWLEEGDEEAEAHHQRRAEADSEQELGPCERAREKERDEHGEVVERAKQSDEQQPPGAQLLVAPAALAATALARGAAPALARGAAPALARGAAPCEVGRATSPAGASPAAPRIILLAAIASRHLELAVTQPPRR